MVENNGGGRAHAAGGSQQGAVMPTEADLSSPINQPLLPGVLRMLEAYTKEASIVLNSHKKVSIQKSGKVRTILHCSSQEKACQHVVPSGGLGLCQEFAKSGNGSGPFDETEKTRQQVVEILAEAIQALSVDEKARLLSTMGEAEFGAFVEQSDDVKKLQSIQYKFTRRVNGLKEKGNRQPPKRPVIERRKVGDYLYKRQAGPKGGIYWYLQFSKDGKRHHVYLGSAEPTFDPATDLAHKQNGKPNDSPAVNTPSASHHPSRI